MQKQLLTWQFIFDNLQQQIPVIILYVLQSKGSSPGRQGFFMAVNNAGEMCGSIGGGIMEHKFVELAKTKLQHSVEEASVHLQVHDKTVAKNQSGMICSGEQTVFIYSIHTNELAIIATLINSLKQNANGCLQLTAKGIQFFKKLPAQKYFFEKKGKTDFIYKEITGYSNHLYIIGGGHCSLAFSQLMSSMDFYIHLYEEREGLNTMEQNKFVHERLMVPCYETLGELVPPGKNNYVVIMTFGYRTDNTALKALLGKDLAYLGLLGSKNKIKKMLGDLKAAAKLTTSIKQLHAPVGLAIKSQTPEEIAVSIAAEIIKVKNEKL